MSRILTLTLNPAIDQTIVLDALVPGSVQRASAVRSHAGGKGVNVASCLADWGLNVAATGILGADNAAPFDQLFARKGIADRFLRIPGETRTNLKLLDKRLDLVAGALARGLLEQVGPAQPVVLSEGGIAFIAPEPFHPGQLLALKLVLASVLFVVAGRMAYEHATAASSVFTAFTRRAVP